MEPALPGKCRPKKILAATRERCYRNSLFSHACQLFVGFICNRQVTIKAFSLNYKREEVDAFGCGWRHEG